MRVWLKTSRCSSDEGEPNITEKFRRFTMNFADHLVQHFMGKGAWMGSSTS